MYQALYRKWRPLRFADVVGQQHITDTLRAQLQSGRLSHAYLFTGTRGTGKTTCAKILARAVNCEHPVNGDPCGECPACRGILDGSVLDVVEIDAASNNGVDNIRDIRDETRYTPTAVKKRVYIIDEVHMLSIGAFNALLKTLEEPPEHVLFILATTEINKVPATILSRCQRFDFRRIQPRDIARRLTEVAAEEKIDLTEGAADLIARLADGAMRDALSMLDRASGAGTVDEDAVTRTLGVLSAQDAVKLLESLKSGDAVQAVALIDEYYAAGRDLAGVYDQLLGLIRDVLLTRAAKGDVSALLSPSYSRQTVEKLGEGTAPATLLAWTQIVQESLTRMRSAANRRIEAELCAVHLCTLDGDDYDNLTGRVEALEEQAKHPIMVAAPLAEQPTAPQVQPEPTPQAEHKDIEKSTENPTPKRTGWNQWAEFLELVRKNSPSLFTMMQLDTEASIQGNQLYLYCGEMSLAMAKQHKEMLSAAAAKIAGQPMALKLRTEDAPEPQTNGLEEIVNKAREMNIEITQE